MSAWTIASISLLSAVGVEVEGIGVVVAAVADCVAALYVEPVDCVDCVDWCVELDA